MKKCPWLIINSMQSTLHWNLCIYGALDLLAWVKIHILSKPKLYQTATLKNLGKNDENKCLQQLRKAICILFHWKSKHSQVNINLSRL